jgi:hypothetical protein
MIGKSSIGTDGWIDVGWFPVHFPLMIVPTQPHTDSEMPINGNNLFS